VSDVNPIENEEPTAAAEPLTPVPAPPPAAPMATGGWGPPGKIRNWGTVAVLTIITCGIYGLFWQYYVFKENKDHSGEGVGGGVGLLFAIFIGIVNIFLLPAEIGNIYAKAGQEKPVHGPTGWWAIIPFVGWFIWLYKVQNAINARWEQMGVRPV
jgi:hypothetical protein